ncbi:MAG: pyrroline-5-carboxylate reductase family protein, partial [Candidatus Acidiferrales bacterium]
MPCEPIQKRLAVLGSGKMGGILIEAFLRQGLVPPYDIAATVKHADLERKFSSGARVQTNTDNRGAARSADVILICVKPGAISELLEEIRPEINGRKLVISIAASVPTDYIEKRLDAGVPVIRAMPNT